MRQKDFTTHNFIIIWNSIGLMNWLIKAFTLCELHSLQRKIFKKKLLLQILDFEYCSSVYWPYLEWASDYLTQRLLPISGHLRFFLTVTILWLSRRSPKWKINFPFKTVQTMRWWAFVNNRLIYLNFFTFLSIFESANIGTFTLIQLCSLF